MATLTEVKQNKHIYIFIFLAIIVGIIGVTIWFLMRNTVLFSHAAVSTSPLVMTPPPSTSNNQGSTTHSCQRNIATCSWDNVPSAIRYHYVISDITTGTVVIQGDLTPPQTSIDFPHQQGDTYSCSVNAINTCQAGPIASVTKTCQPNPASISLTPTTDVPSTATPTQTQKITELNYSLHTPTSPYIKAVAGASTGPQAPGPTLLAQAVQSTDTPTPTQEDTLTPTDSVTPTQDTTTTGTAIPTATPAQLMSTGPGNMFIQVGIVAAIIAIFGGLLIFAL